MHPPIRDFTDLLVWQKAMNAGQRVYDITASFPRDERYGLTAQLRKAAVSTSSNIAEGHARQGREFPHFLSIAKGSLAEIESQLIFAARRGYVAQDIVDCFRVDAGEIHRMLASLIEKLENR
jgi:four helix bundle protein